MSQKELTPNTAAARSSIDWPCVQAIPGLCFAGFLALHLAATVSAIFGEAAFTFVQHAGRRIYQISLLELGLVAAFAAHLGAAWQQRQRARSALRGNLRRRLHRYAAIYLRLFGLD